MTILSTTLSTICTDILDFIFPRRCITCLSALVVGEEHLCTHCMHRLPFTAHFGQDDNMAETRFADLECPMQAASLLNYSKETNVHRIIYNLKYSNNKKLAFMMGKLMAEAAQPWPQYSGADFLVPVPLHYLKKWRRGYNQAEWICRGISSVWGTPIAPRALRRRVATAAQAGKSHLERRDIMHNNVFVANRIEGLEGKRLLLVDDVLTTGSTLTACAMPLLRIPGVRVCVLTLAIA